MSKITIKKRKCGEKNHIFHYSTFVFLCLTFLVFVLLGCIFYDYVNVRSNHIKKFKPSIRETGLEEDLSELNRIRAGLSEKMEIRDVEGSPAGNSAETVLEDLEKSIENYKMLADSDELYDLPSFLEKHENLLVSTPSIWPARGFVSSGFGFRRFRMHNGIDIANKPGTEIKASADGVVVYVGIRGGYGNLVIIDHSYHTSTRYGHLSSMGVKVGDSVKRGEVIGNMGNTGRSTGPHLHYEVRVNGVPVNPTKYIFN